MIKLNHFFTLCYFLLPQRCHASPPPLGVVCGLRPQQGTSRGLPASLSHRRFFDFLRQLSIVLLSRFIISHHPLVAQPSCLLSSHCAGCLLRCLSLHRLSSTLVVTATFASALPCLVFAVERCQMLLPALNLPFTTIIEHHLYCPLLPQLPSIATVKCQCPPSSIAVVKH